MQIFGRERTLGKIIYAEHLAWLMSDGTNGIRLDLDGQRLNGLRARSLNLQKIRLTNCSATGANFEFGRLDGAELHACDLSGAVLARVSMENAVLDGGVLRGADLQGGNFCATQLTDVDAAEADLKGARLRDVRASGVVLAGASMEDVVLDGSRWTDCDFRGARLTRANDAADLGKAHDVVFERCDFRHTEWTGFRLRDVRFVGCRFQDARGRPQIEGSWFAEGTDGSEAGDGSVMWTRERLASQWGLESSSDPGRAVGESDLSQSDGTLSNLALEEALAALGTAGAQQDAAASGAMRAAPSPAAAIDRRGRLTESTYKAHLTWLASNGASGTRLELDKTTLDGLQADAMDLRRLHLSNCSAAGANFEFARLDGAEFHTCNLSGAIMGRGSTTGILIEGGSLRGADLRLGNLTASELADVDATKTDFLRAKLENVKANRVVLANALMVDSVLDGSRWTDCDFRGARMARARKDLDLGRAHDVVFERCDFRDTDWTGFRLADVRFTECRFHNVKGQPEIEGAWSAEGTDGSEVGDRSVIWSRDQLAEAWGLSSAADPGSKLTSDSDGRRARDELVERGRAVMQRAMDAFQDPDIEARIAASEEAEGRRQALLLIGARMLENPPRPKEAFLRNATELRHYLTMRNARDIEDGVQFEVGPVGSEKRVVVAEWRSEQGEVKLTSTGFTTVVKLDADGSLSSLALEEALAAHYPG